MKTYPAYRESGVEWLGEVPEGWEVVPVKARLSVVGGTTPKSDQPAFWDGDIPWITPADLSNLPNRFIYETGRQITQLGLDSCGTTIVPAGSIVLSTRAPIGSIAVTTVPACTNQGCKLLIPRRGTEADYYYYALLSAREQLNLLGRGSTFLELSGDQLAAFRVPLPPLSEQQAIAAFLDRETAKIDGLIEEQRRLIALLAEKRQATISHAVTRGLNPDAKLKPSGVDWLGDIPEGWDVVPLSAYFRASKGPRGQILTKEYCGANEGDFPVYSGQTENNGVMGLIADYDFDAGEDGVLFSTTVGAKAMTVSLVSGKFSLSQNCMVIAPASGKTLPSFYFYHFTPLFAYFRGMIPEYMQASFRMADLYKFKIALPPLQEQWQIANHLDAILSEQAILTETATTAITLLQERRAALISAAVTGKIDVREAVVPATAPRQTMRVSAIVAGIVIAKHGRQQDHGRVWLQKMLFMAQTHANIDGIGGNYLRAAHGPLDIGLRNQVEADLSAANAIRVTRESGEQGAYRYDFIGNASQFRADLAAEIGDRLDGFLRLMDLLGDMGTKQIEAVATLYAVWNDFLIDGKAPSDADLIHEVLENWHPKKKERLSVQYLSDQLVWMRRQGIVPEGTGQKTYTDRLFP